VQPRRVEEGAHDLRDLGVVLDHQHAQAGRNASAGRVGLVGAGAARALGM
jgi:hypothetical protein